MKLLKCPFTLLALFLAVLFLIAACATLRRSLSGKGSFLTPSGTRITSDGTKRTGIDIEASGQGPGAVDVVPE